MATRHQQPADAPADEAGGNCEHQCGRRTARHYDLFRIHGDAVGVPIVSSKPKLQRWTLSMAQRIAVQHLMRDGNGFPDRAPLVAQFARPPSDGYGVKGINGNRHPAS
jgi:hypothetical protein